MKQRFYSRTISILVLYLIAHVVGYGQSEGNIWYFGEGSGVNFNQGCNILDESSAMQGIEGTVSLCSPDGELLFYTNGGDEPAPSLESGKIWNRNHEVMYDMGTSQGGGASSRQSSIAIPKIGSPNSYYLFTVDDNESLFGGAHRGLSYFEIDMSLNGGLGEVVDYQESIVTQVSEGIGGVLRPDGNSYWIIVTDFLGGYQYLLIDEEGVSLDHQQPIIDGADSPYTFSPDGKYISTGSNVVEFDTETGLYSNVTNFISTAPFVPLGSAFSPNSRYFYVAEYGNRVFRFDLQAPDIAASQTILYEFSEFTVAGDMAIAPDGNIYFLHSDFINSPNQMFFSGILCPNSETPCIKEGIYAFPATSFGQHGLPNFTDHYFASNVIEAGLDICVEASDYQICSGEEITLTAFHFLAETYEWSTGASTPDITVNEPGLYTVTVSDGCCNAEVGEIEIFSGADGELSLEIDGPTVICGTEPITLTANAPFAASFEWSNGSTNSTIQVATPGNYSVTVTDLCGTNLNSTIEVVAGADGELTLDINGPSLICNSEPITLSANSPFAAFVEWSTGETNADIEVSTPGTYSVTVTGYCSETLNSSVEIIEGSLGELTLELNGPTLICDDAPITLIATSPLATYFEWSDGSTTPELQILTPGTYSVSVADLCGTALSSEVEVLQPEVLQLELELEGEFSCTGQIIATVNTNTSDISWSTGEQDAEIIITQAGSYTINADNGCETLSETFDVTGTTDLLKMPNAFTPDEDGFNDVFRPVWGCDDISNFNMSIFNRWGAKVFESSDPDTGWNGSLNGQPAVSDVFFYQLSFEVSNGEILQYAGDLTLIR